MNWLTRAAERSKSWSSKIPELEKWYWIRREEAIGPPQIRWLTDPRELGLKYQKWTPDPNNPPMDAIDHLWESIKAQLPPHMIDTPEKCDAVAKDIGFLIGFWGERVAYRILRTLGIVP